VEPLARIVHEKTLGNPFFLNQLLQLLHKEKLVLFNASSGAFQWDLEQIRRAPATSNVVDLMVAQLMRLSEETRYVLSLAACIGHRFDLHTLSLIHGRSMVQTAHALWEALAEGFILPLDGDYRFVHDPGLKDGDELPANLSVSYRFLHDRVQQAAYQLTDEAERPALHLRIGRLLLERAEGVSGAESGALAEHLFDVADHLNRGASLIDDPEDRLALARLDLAAGKKAKAAAAYASAAHYLATGVAALPEAALGEHHDLAFELRLEHAQCEYLGGHLERAEALFDDLFPSARSRLERTRIQTLRIMLYITQARIADALATSRAALSEFGLLLPDTPEAQALMCEAELAAIEEKRAGREPDQLIDLAVSQDPEHCAVLRLFMVTAPSAYLVSPGLLSLINTVPVRLSLEHGNTEYSAFGYVAFANLLCAKLGRYREGYAYGQLAIALNERFRNTELAGKTYETFAGHVQHFRAPLRDSLEVLDAAYRASLSAGDFNYLSYVTIMLAINRFGLGDELGALADLAARHGALTAQIKDAPGMAFHRATRELIARFVARGGPGRADEPFDEAQFLTTMEKVGLSLVACWFNAGMAKLLLLQERYAESLAATAEAERLLSSAAGCYFTTTVPFYACLAMLALYPDVSGDDRARFDAEIARHRAHLAHLADNCPHNYRHCLRLVDAEIARVKGELDAVRLYDLAIADARTSGFLHHEALASELAAKLYRALSNLEIAATYMTDAHACYVRWGALAKVAQIEQRYADLLVVNMPAALSSTGTATSRQRLSARSFDVTAVMRAAQAIASEIVLPRVVERLLRIAVAHAGAQRGALLLVKGDHLLLEASFSVDPEAIEVGLAAPLGQRPELPRTILGFVMRTRETLVLADVSVDPRFAADAAFSSRRPRAVLCSPLVHQGRLAGLLYLEHAAAAGVFDPTRAELLSLLSAQAAIALQNASLLSDLGAATDEVRRTNEGLEAEVQRRTDELSRSNDELAAAKRMLEVELEERARAEEERVRAEEERARLQAQVIAAQEARLVELSTPFIPITDDVVVMPLIGAIDPQRAEQIMDVALHGAQSRGAKVVILDITGVKHADGTADTLVRTARALRMLGAETILTGIRPEIARALLETGAELSAVTTRSTLQGAIAHALARSSGRRGRS
jgi:predicted ATPase/GAF domain-containing protein